MDTKRICSVCGKPLAPNAPEGLCPECLLKAGLGTGVDIGSDTGKSPRFTPPKTQELAAKFPQLEILELIGQGGMGAVYKARQKQLDRVAALKILPPQASDAAFAERFMREARALAKLNHPHIVTLYEFGQSDGLFYFLMEFVDGVNLRQLLGNSRISPREALAIVPQICEALQFAHDSGVVHRDIKPENILLDKKGQVKIADFGVAKMIAESLNEAAEKSGTTAGDLTEAGSTLGTLQYMAPEQIKSSSEVDHRADIYSLGVVFYQMLTGELPSSKIEAPSRKVHIDVRLDEIVLRALEKKLELRFQQASELKTAVETIATTPQAPLSSTPSGLPKTQNVTAEEPKPESGGQKEEPELHTEGYTVRIEPVNAPKFARRFSTRAVFAFLAILLAVLLGSIAILNSKRTEQPKDKHVLSEAQFLQKFNSHQIAQANVTYPAVSGGATTITGKFFATDVNGKIVQQNGKPVEESFVVQNFRLTPAIENKLVRSKNINVNIHNPPNLGFIGIYELLFFVFVGCVAIVFINLVVYLFARKTRAPPVISGPGAGAASATDRRGWFNRFLIILLAIIVIALFLRSFVVAPHRTSLNAGALKNLYGSAAAQTNVLFHFRVFEADADLVDKLIPIRERRDGVQPNVESAYTYTSDNFHTVTRGIRKESRFAPVTPAVVYRLLQGIMDTPGLLVDQTKQLSCIWWQPTSPGAGFPVTWNYSLANHDYFGNGGGSAFLGVRNKNGSTDVRIDGTLHHSVDVIIPGCHSYALNENNCRFLYEGTLPQTKELVFLMPFLRNDDSQHYLVTVFDFNGENKQETPTLALSGPPFTTQLRQATIELAAVGDEPWTNPVCWYPNGEASPKAFPTNHQSDGIPTFGLGMTGKKLVFYIHNRSTNDVSMPICHVEEPWPPNVSSIWLAPYKFDHAGYFGLTLGVPTNATAVNLSIGVANGPWETVVSMDRNQYSVKGQGTAGDNWKGTYNSVMGTNGDVAVGCSYTTQSNWVSRIAYLNSQEEIVPISETSSGDDYGNPANGTLLISSNEYRHIKAFLVQRRKFQWIEFDNISLRQGHRTSVTVKGDIDYNASTSRLAKTKEGESLIRR